MSGEELKVILFANNIQQSMLAEGLGISKQSFSQLLKAVDVKSGTLEKICALLGKDMTFFYPVEANNNINNVRARNNDSNPQTDNSIVVLEKLIDEIATLRRINEKLTEKLLG